VLSMIKKRQMVAAHLAIAALIFTIPATAKRRDKAPKPNEKIAAQKKTLLWRNPDDIKSRNLFYGPGGKEHAPDSTCTFEKEDLNGTSPKFDVRDEKGIKWKVKMGPEARPETVASRLVWAVGYSVNEDYFLPELQVQDMPERLRRGQNFVHPKGTVHNVRLKRYIQGEKKVADWQWKDNPFTDTRELNGFRVVMALINNWDLKDNNNAIYEEKHAEGSPSAEQIYMASDLGASFGATGLGWSHAKSKGNLKAYSHSKFVSKVTPDSVDFNVPTRPALINIFDLPEFISRLQLRWIGKDIPREDARWIGQLLAQLSSAQIRDAFRAASYTPDQVEGFAQTVEARIAELNKL
jgi:hypothetical protein